MNSDGETLKNFCFLSKYEPSSLEQQQNIVLDFYIWYEGFKTLRFFQDFCLIKLVITCQISMGESYLFYKLENLALGYLKLSSRENYKRQMLSKK